MAIGKVNAYATVEAPKADFGAVAQLNIDNLVKSVKEDEQLKVAKKVAEDKAKKERSEEFGDFVEFDASGVSLQDQYSGKEAVKLLPKWLENKELYKQTSDPKYLTEGKRIIGYIKGVNKNTAVLKESVDRFAIAAGKDQIASKWSKEGMKRIKSLENGNIVFGRGDDGNGAVATYEDTPDGGKKKKLEEKYPDWLSILSNAPNAIKFTDELQKDKNLFEKNLTETQVNALRKEGTKAISGATKTAIEKLVESKMNDDRLLAVYLSEIGATADDDLRTSGFGITERKKAVDAYTKQLISLYGVDKTVEVKQAASQPKEEKKEVKGQANVSIDSPFKLLKANFIKGYTSGANDETQMTSVPLGSFSYPVGPKDMPDATKMDSAIGGKSGAVVTPTSFYTSPDGDLYLTATSKSSEQISAGGVYSGTQTTEGNNYVFSYRDNGTEFTNAAKGILNTQPTWDLPGGGTMEIKTNKDIWTYFDKVSKLTGGKGLSRTRLKVGTPSSGTKKKEEEEPGYFDKAVNFVKNLGSPSRPAKRSDGKVKNKRGI